VSPLPGQRAMRLWYTRISQTNFGVSLGDGRAHDHRCDQDGMRRDCT